jgi:hypothetical protein
MGPYSRQSAEESHLCDEVYAVIEHHGVVVLGDGRLTYETKQDTHSILAALALLEAEGKITVTRNPKEEIIGASLNSDKAPAQDSSPATPARK